MVNELKRYPEYETRIIGSRRSDGAVPLPLLVSLATQGWTQLLATTAVSTLSLALCLPAAGLLPCERRLLLRTLKKHFGCHA